MSNHPRRPIIFISSFNKLSLLLFILCHCSQSPEPASHLLSEPNSHFFERASELLRAGRLPSEPELVHWQQIGKEAAVTEMLADPLFASTVLDFNLFFLGDRPPALRPFDSRWGGKIFAEAAYARPNAIHAAKEVSADGNYFVLFDQQQPLYVHPIARAEDELRGDDLLRAKFDLVRALFPDTSTPVSPNTCTELQALLVEDDIQNVLRDARFQESISDQLRLVFRRQVARKCTATVTDAAESSGTMRRRVEAVAAQIDALYQYEGTQSRLSYPQQLVSDIRDAKDVIPALSFANDALTREGFWRTYVNSSTNYNRKRARYVLDRFFCDDLTPVELPASVTHGEGRHASDPACQSCHYRLDPMAGFFRNSGNRGRNREGANYIDFDDESHFENAQYEAYMDTWKNTDTTSTRLWNIGYVRDPSHEDRNSYGTKLSDLFALFATAPEVRQCVVRRMAEYILGPKQAVDGIWLAETGAPLLNTAPPQSGAAFKEVVQKLVLSETFSATNPYEEECYDVPAGGAVNGAPCRARWILVNNCQSCHSGPASRGGLDVSTWISGPDGQMVFQHVAPIDGTTRQLTRGESFDRIKARLSTSSALRIMPPTYMAPEQRISLLHFLSTDEVHP